MNPDNSNIPYIDFLSSEQQETIHNLMKRSETDLYIALGRTLGGAATGEDSEDRGRRVFSRRLNGIRDIICANSVLRTFCEDPNTSDLTSIALAITGALLASKFAGLDPVLIGCLMARIGLRNICSEKWGN